MATATKKQRVEEEPEVTAPPAKLTKKQEEQLRVQSLLGEIAKLGGQGMKDEDIVYTGEKLVLPERWKGELAEAINYLETKQKEDEATAAFSRVYNYRPWDGAYNAFQAMKKAFGMVAGKTTYSFFGKQPPNYIQIQVGIDQTEEVPWGTFSIPLLKKTEISFGPAHSDDYGQVFGISIESPRKNKFVIEGLFKLIEKELQENSIYRGKAIDGQEMPQFIDTRAFDQTKVVYSEQVQSDLDAHLWGVLRYSEANRKLGLPLKRSILLTGPYGTGKSLAGMRTAVEAQEFGWTFIMARPGRDDFQKVMQTARLYQPAVVFMEDVDTIASAQSDMVGKLLDLFDGIQAKGTDLMVVLTTNHPERLHKGMMRPGRVDAIIDIHALDGKGIEKLVRSLIDEKRLDPKVDFDPIVAACEGYPPAFVKEAADRAIRYALARSDGNINGYSISTEDLVFASQGLRPQYERMEGAPEQKRGDTFGSVLNESVRKAVTSLLPPDPNAQLWNREEVEIVRQKQLSS